MRHSPANRDLCTHFAIAKPFGTTPRAVRDGIKKSLHCSSDRASPTPRLR